MRRSDNNGELDVQSRRPAGEAGSLLRLLVPIDVPEWSSTDGLANAVAMSVSTPAVLRLVHVRLWDPPVRGYGRFYLETSEQATTVVETALNDLWACHLQASGVVVDAPRGNVAMAIASEGSDWGADMIVMASRPRRTLAMMLGGGSLAQQVMRETNCPVLVVRSDHR
jgi:nucleotide-binding universal stress UspA family protein